MKQLLFQRNYFKSWIHKIGYSITDQVLFSGSNFILNILLVRWLGAEKYGAFSLGFSIFLVGSGFYNGFLLEPVSVLGSRHLGDRFYYYTKVILNIHFIVTVVFSLIVVIIGFAFHATNPLLSSTFYGLSIGLPFMLLYWLFRQVCYIQMNPTRAFWGSLLYAILLITFIICLKKINLISSFSSFIIMALASLLTVLAFWPRTKNSLHNQTFASRKQIQIIVKENYAYGKWVILTAIFYSISTFLYPPLIAYFLSLNETGLLKAMQNLVLPLQQTLTAFSLLFLPWLTRKKIESGTLLIFHRVNQLGILYLLITGVYLTLLIIFGDQILRLVYQSAQLDSYIWVLPFLCLTTLFTTIYSVSSITIRVLERPDAIFRANVASALFTVVVGISLVKLYGFPGAIISIMGSSFILLVVVLLQYFVICKQIRTDNIKA